MVNPNILLLFYLQFFWFLYIFSFSYKIYTVCNMGFEDKTYGLNILIVH
jgi:hypothetical protein